MKCIQYPLQRVPNLKWDNSELQFTSFFKRELVDWDWKHFKVKWFLYKSIKLFFFFAFQIFPYWVLNLWAEQGGWYTQTHLRIQHEMYSSYKLLKREFIDWDRNWAHTLRMNMATPKRLVSKKWHYCCWALQPGHFFSHRSHVVRETNHWRELDSTVIDIEKQFAIQI